MFEINIIDLIPKALRQKAVDVTVDFVVDLGKGYLSDELTRRIKKLRSDGEFQGAFDDGLQRAAKRFIEEYADRDEDLVEAIASDQTFFQNEDVQKALLVILKKPGVYLADQQETVIESFDNVLPNRRNRERVDQAVSYFLKCLAEEVWSLPELRPIYELQFQRMTAEAIQTQVTLQKDQLERSMALSSDIRDALWQFTNAMAEQKLLPGGQEVNSLLPLKVRHNLPQPGYERFVGRKTELQKIRKLLAPKTRHFVFSIDGIGGIGKSALALEVADSYLRYYERLPEEERFDVIVWTTAKQTLLTGEGITTKSQSLQNLSDIYTTIAATLERDDIIRAPLDQQDALIRQVLTQQRTLLIVDNLETVDDERVLNFIREVPDPTKVIVTTRHRIDVAYAVRLVGMPSEDALALIADEAKQKGVTLTQDDAQRLYQRTGGVPLAIVWSVAQMGFGYGVEAMLTRLGQPTSDVAKFCFEAAVERIRNKPAYQLLLALSIFAVDASRIALGFVTDLPDLDRNDGLVELEKLSLVNKQGNRFQLLPLTLVYSKAKLENDVDLEKTLRKRWVTFFLNFLSEHQKNRYKALDSVKLEQENILNAMDWCWQNNWLGEFIELTRKMDFYLWVTGNWNAQNRYTELGLKAADSAASELVKADFWRLLATQKNVQDELDEARHYIQKAIAVYQSYGEKDELTNSFRRLGAIQIKCGEYEAARQSLKKAWELAESLNSKRHITRIQRQLARIDIAEGDYDSAENNLLQAIKWREEQTDLSSGLAYSYRLLGNVLLLKENRDLARQYFQQSMELVTRIDNQVGIAEVNRGLAELEMKSGNIEAARQLATEAAVVFENLGMRREFREISSLLEQINTEAR